MMISRRTPRSVLWARVLVPVAMLWAYMAFRVYPARDGRIPLYEVIIMGAVVIGCTFLALGAATDLLVRSRDRLADDVSPLELTAPIEGLDELTARETATDGFFAGTLVDHGEATDLLFTHDFTPAYVGRHRLAAPEPGTDAFAHLNRAREF